MNFLTRFSDHLLKLPALWLRTVGTHVYGGNPLRFSCGCQQYDLCKDASPGAKIYVTLRRRFMGGKNLLARPNQPGVWTSTVALVRGLCSFGEDTYLEFSLYPRTYTCGRRNPQGLYFRNNSLTLSSTGLKEGKKKIETRPDSRILFYCLVKQLQFFSFDVFFLFFSFFLRSYVARWVLGILY